MRRYYALVYKDENSAYGAQFPDIPGIFSAADNERDIIANAAEALQLWFEDAKDIINPSVMEELLQKEEVREALAAGAFFVSVPLIDNDSEIVRANVSFERGLLREIDRAAHERKLNRSAFLAAAARHELGLG